MLASARDRAAAERRVVPSAHIIDAQLWMKESRESESAGVLHGAKPVHCPNWCRGRAGDRSDAA